jgi:chorismate mutase
MRRSFGRVADNEIKGFAGYKFWKRTTMAVRGIRGATSVAEDTREAVLAATRELLEEILKTNRITQFDDIASILFTTTPDLTSTFPAEAARALGMNQVPLLCASEINVPGRLPRCVRVLMHLNTEKRACEIVHSYLREAKSLRPDVNSAQ